MSDVVETKSSNIKKFTDKTNLKNLNFQMNYLLWKTSDLKCLNLEKLTTY